MIFTCILPPMCFSVWPACCWDSSLRLACMDPQSIHVWMNVHLTLPNLLHSCLWAKCLSGVLSFFMVTFVSPELVNCLLISIEWCLHVMIDSVIFAPLNFWNEPSTNMPVIRLTLNEVLRCKPGSLIVMAPDCRSLSKMYLVFLDMVSYYMLDQLWKKCKLHHGCISIWCFSKVVSCSNNMLHWSNLDGSSALVLWNRDICIQSK